MADINIVIHRSLNPKLWDGDTIKPEVRKQLSAIGNEFIDFCGVPIKVKDVWIVGSSVNYTWNPASDIDIQVIVEYGKDDDKALMTDFFDTKKKVFKRDHPIKIYGMPVEITVSDDSTVAGSQGCYSLRNNAWVNEPVKKSPDVDETRVGVIADKWRKQILSTVRDENSTPSALDNLQDRIKSARSKELEANDGDDFGVTNLAYKHIRSKGYLDLLKRVMRQKLTKRLSLKN